MSLVTGLCLSHLVCTELAISKRGQVCPLAFLFCESATSGMKSQCRGGRMYFASASLDTPPAVLANTLMNQLG